MAFSPLLQVVIVKKACRRGGHGHPRTPPPPLGYAYAIDMFQIKVMEPFISKKLRENLCLGYYAPIIVKLQGGRGGGGQT